MSRKFIILAIVGICLLTILVFIGQVYFTLWAWNALAVYFGFKSINLGIAFIITAVLWTLGTIFSRSAHVSK